MRPTATAEVDGNLIDPVGETGCEAQNDAVLLCYAENKDWRRCKTELEAFKKCMELYEKQRIK